MAKKIIEYDVYVIPLDSEEKIPAKLIDNGQKRLIQISFLDKVLSVDDDNDTLKFWELRDLDEKLNKIGYRLLCNATSIGVDCRGFCISMSMGTKIRRYDVRTFNVFEYSYWNKYATRKEQIDFFNFTIERTKGITEKMGDAKERGATLKELSRMLDEWLKEKGITLENFWKKELWE
jgi:hypothetical protein